MATEILMPALSPTMTEGTLAAWLVQEGATVVPGDLIAEIETDKATMEVEAIEEGTVAKLVVPAGTEGVAVNSVIAILVEEGETFDPDALPSAPPATATKGSGGAPPPQPPAAPPGASAPASPAPAAHATTRRKASPLARRLARAQGLDLARIDGSGPGGRIIKRDIESATAAQEVRSIAAPAATPHSSGPTPYEVHAPSGVRKTIARRLSESKFTSPHFYVTMDMELDALLALRQQINADSDTPKVSVNDMIVMACGRALKAVPAANAAWVGEVLHQYTRADVCVAVASDHGLVTPVIRGADTLSLSQITAQAGALVTKARAGKLRPEDMQGGSFSISNMGMMGVKQFTAIINPPQGAILAVGAGEKRAVVRDDQLAIATLMTCTLSADHRVIDGAVAAELLGKIKSLIEHPVRMLV